MNRIIDYSSKFRILKGGKISLVVSALLVSVSLSTPANALEVTGAETTTQQAATLINDLEVTTGSITITDDAFNTKGLYTNENIANGRTVSNAGTISLTNSTETVTLTGIAVYADNEGTITNSDTIIVNNSVASRQAKGVDLTNNSGTITFESGSEISVTAQGKAKGLSLDAHTGTITNHSSMSITSVNDNAYGILVATTMTNATITNSDTVGNEIYVKAGDQAYGIQVEGAVTDSTITNSGTIETLADDKATGLYFKQGLSGSTSVTNAGTLGVTSNGDNAYGIWVEGDSEGNIVNSGTFKIDGDADSYGLTVSGSFEGTITNSGTFEVTGGGDISYGIYITDNFTGVIDNNQVGSEITVENSGDGVAKGIVIKGTFESLIDNTNMDIDALVGEAIGIEIETAAAGSTITNSANLYVDSIEGDATGIYVEINNGTIDNDGGGIFVKSRDGNAKGIEVDGGTGTIIVGADDNSGPIIVESTNGIATGVSSSSNNITNTGVIFAHKGNYELDWKAFAINSSDGDVNNEHRLHGNIQMSNGTLTNSGTIKLPHNASGAYYSLVDNFINESTGTLTIGLQTDGTTTTHSQFFTNNATFEDGSTIGIDVTSASANVGNIAGET